MRFLFSRRIPAIDRILVVESAPRAICEKFLQHVYERQPAERVDILTCYGSAPQNYDHQRGSVFLTQQAATSNARWELIRHFKAQSYSAVAIFCAGDTLMRNWKWAIAAKVPAKILIINENADFFWLDRKHWRNARALITHRTGFHGSGPLRVMQQMITLPFAIVFLAGYAAVVHAKRTLRSLSHTSA